MSDVPAIDLAGSAALILTGIRVIETSMLRPQKMQKMNLPGEAQESFCVSTIRLHTI